MLKAGIRKLRKITGNYYKRTSYSQCGEDLILSLLISKIGLKKLTYLEIGTNHPLYFNNTYMLYKNGFRGVCVEPDPSLCKTIKLYRSKDTVLNVGISEGQEGNAPFYIMNVNTLNTFDKKGAEELNSEGTYTIKKIIEIPLRNINNIIAENFGGATPNFICIDVEGWNEQVVKSIDFEKYQPEILCLETSSFAPDHSEVKLHNIIEYVLGKGYKIFADTYVNTIFYKENAF